MKLFQFVTIIGIMCVCACVCVCVCLQLRKLLLLTTYIACHSFGKISLLKAYLHSSITSGNENSGNSVYNIV